MEENGADHVAGSTAQDEGGIKGLSDGGKNFNTDLFPGLNSGKPSPTKL